MKFRNPWVLTLSLFVVSCGGPATLPSAPTPVFERLPLDLPFTRASIGEVIEARITSDDARCDYAYRCRYFLVVAPDNGVLEVGLTHEPSSIHTPPMTPIDMWILGPAGATWMDPHVAGVESFSRVVATRGETYQIGVVSYDLPGVRFQLRLMLKPA